MTRALCVVLIALSCSSAGEWPQRDTFYSQTRCDFSVDEARSLASRLGGSAWSCGSPTSGHDLCSFSVGQTRANLEFENGRLRSVEDGDRFGITGMAMRPKVNVCTGEKSRQIDIAPRDGGWVGATVNVDGRMIGTVTTSTSQGLYVPLGRHTLRVEKPGRDPFVHEIDVAGGALRQTPEVVLP